MLCKKMQSEHATYENYRLAEDTSKHKLVAVKRLMSPFLSVERTKFCFRELSLLGNLRHPNVKKLPILIT